MNRRICLNFPSLRDLTLSNRGNPLDFLQFAESRTKKIHRFCKIYLDSAFLCELQNLA
ncbi:hypothetical protein ACWIUD_11890 [Helicobacter sp. 23-1044]